MPDTNRTQLATAVLLEQVLRKTYVRLGPQELQPAQWSALRYFKRTYPEGGTVSELSKFLGVTAGPASRAAHALEQRGLLEARVNPEDKRSTLFCLTPQGKAKLVQDPMLALAQNIAELDPSDQDALAQTLLKLTSLLKIDTS
ncbi:MarR family transcriptional regulator [Paramylibacter kogurei]|uniref:MarR family transcriptional regulator n=1 Tax=Paramylibacter kogurei TaxID=1889778 RepID=UPI0013FD244D|nr:MarR family transcriptional regulator [Amylibacter kogurei]